MPGSASFSVARATEAPRYGQPVAGSSNEKQAVAPRHSADFVDIELQPIDGRMSPAGRKPRSPDPLLPPRPPRPLPDAAQAARPPPWSRPLATALSASAQFFGLKTHEQRRLRCHLLHLMDEAELSQRTHSSEVALVLYESIEQACLAHQLDPCELMFGADCDFPPGSPLHVALGGHENGPLVTGLMRMASRYVDVDAPLTLWTLFGEENWPQSYEAHVALEQRREAWLRRQGAAARRALEAGLDDEVSRRLAEIHEVDGLRVHRRHYLRHKVRTEPIKHVGLGLKPWHLAQRYGCQRTLWMLGQLDPHNHQRFIMGETNSRQAQSRHDPLVRWSSSQTDVAARGP